MLLWFAFENEPRTIFRVPLPEDEKAGIAQVCTVQHSFLVVDRNNTGSATALRLLLLDAFMCLSHNIYWPEHFLAIDLMAQSNE